MSTIIIPTPEQWAVLDALGILDSGSFLIVNPADAAELREKRGLDLQHGQHTKVATGLGEDDVFIAFVGTDSWIVDELVGDEPDQGDEPDGDEPTGDEPTGDEPSQG